MASPKPVNLQAILQILREENLIPQNEKLDHRKKSKRGRAPSLKNPKTLSFYAEKEVWEKFKRKCKEKNKSASEMMRYLIEKYVNEKNN